jgi:hypothetical protein
MANMTAETPPTTQENVDYNMDAVQLHEIDIDGGAKRPLITPADKAHSGIRLLKGKTVVTVSDLLSPTEVQRLQRACIQAASRHVLSNDDDEDREVVGRVCVRMPTQAAAGRRDLPDAGTEQLHDPLPAELSEAVETVLLKRTMEYIDSKLPDVVQTLFGYDVSLVRLFLDRQLEWSTREPAVNVYYPPRGHFGIHRDNKALTVLMPLTSPREDFQGGGTAFWSQSYPNETRHAPSLTLSPKAGTALLFGGKVPHKGLHISEGIRVVFVASFSRKADRIQAKTWTVAAR